MKHRLKVVWGLLVVVPLVLWTVWCGLMRVEPAIFADPWLRAVVRISLLLVPALVYCYIAPCTGDFFYKQWRRGVWVGVGVVLLLLVPDIIYRTQIQTIPWAIPTSGAIWMNFIIGSPFAEELLFRALLLRELETIWRPPVAIVVNALLFACFHLPQWVILGNQGGWEVITSFLVIAGYGIAFALLFRLTKSIWGPLIPHIANNFVGIALAAAGDGM